MRALAHPQRSAILKLLMSGPPRTATECAAVVGASPSACSYHLRELERFGFVERDAPPATHRSTAGCVGGGRRRSASRSARPLSDATPEERAVFAAVLGADRVENERLAREFVESVADLPGEWQDAAEFSTYELALTPGELAELARQIDDLLRPHRWASSAARQVARGPSTSRSTPFRGRTSRERRGVGGAAATSAWRGRAVWSTTRATGC